MSRFRRIKPVSEDSIEERIEPSNVSEISNHSIATLNDTKCSHGGELEPDVSIIAMVDESDDETESFEGGGEEQSQLEDSEINGR